MPQSVKSGLLFQPAVAHAIRRCGARAAERRPAAAASGAGGLYGTSAADQTPSGHSRRGIPMPPSRWILEPSAGIVIEHGMVAESELLRLREQFWTTRTENSPQAWEALHLCADTLLQGDAGLAHTILVESDLRVGGRAGLSEVWDPRGQLYRVPRYCWQTPSNVAKDEVVAAARSHVLAHVGPAKPLRVVFRLSPSSVSDEQDVALSFPSDTVVASLRTALNDHLKAGSADLAPGADHSSRNRWKGVGLPPAWQTIAYSGQVLSGDQHLQAIEFRNGSVMQVFVRPPKGAAPVNEKRDSDAGAAAAAAAAASR